MHLSAPIPTINSVSIMLLTNHSAFVLVHESFHEDINCCVYQSFYLLILARLYIKFVVIKTEILNTLTFAIRYLHCCHHEQSHEGAVAASELCKVSTVSQIF